MRLCLRSALVVAGAVMVLATIARVHVWHSPLSVWGAAVAHSPEKPRPWINYGVALTEVGGDALASMAFTTGAALSVDPARVHVEGPMRGRHVALWNLAIQHVNAGRYDAALALTAEIQPRPEGRASLVTRMEAQWRYEQTHGGPSQGF